MQILSHTNLFYPVYNHCPCMLALLQYFGMHKHRIPLRSKFIIPEEISNNLGRCILKDSSTTVNWRACLITKSPSDSNT